jgi:predicted small secreted protein
MAMKVSMLRRKIAAVSAIAALCAALAGCASDTGAQTSAQSGSHELRYYGGPKSPMWRSQ